MNRKRLLMSVSVLFAFSLLGVSMSNGSIASSSTTGAAGVTVPSYCTLLVESYWTFHLSDHNGFPIPNATVILNGTFSCMPAPPDFRLDQSTKTDSNGDASFVVVPYAKYNATVIFPGIMAVNIGRIVAPTPTSWSTITVTCEPLSNYCTIGSSATTTRTTAGQTTRTTTETVTKTGSLTGFPDVLSFFLGIIVMVLGVVLIVALRKTGWK